MNDSPRRILVYKRTHAGDPDPRTNVWGVWDCMKSLRDREYDAVIGIGGVGLKGPAALRGTLHWIGVAPKKRRGWCRQGYIATLVRFDRFNWFVDDEIDLRGIAPLLAERMYDGRIRHLMVDDRFPAEFAQAKKLLRMYGRRSLRQEPSAEFLALRTNCIQPRRG